MKFTKTFVAVSLIIMVSFVISGSILGITLFEMYQITTPNEYGATRNTIQLYPNLLGVIIGGQVGAICGVLFIILTKNWWLYPQ